MSDYSYIPVSETQGEFEFDSNPLSQVTEDQVKKNFCFIVAPETGEVIFFKTQEMWKQAAAILHGFDYRVFYCHEIMKANRTKNLK